MPDNDRPGLRWLSLDGPWDLVFDDDDAGLGRRWGPHGLPGPGADAPRRAVIRVPFVFQSRASGIGAAAGVHEVLWYQRRIPDLRPAEDRARGCRLLLRFGAVDYEARVWVDGRFVGAHRGGHVPFDLDVSDAVDGALSEHRLTVRVYDSAHDRAQPRGKQFWGPRPDGIFYTPSSGIWQSVWLEVVPPARIADSSHGTLVRYDDIESGTLSCHVAVLGPRRRRRCCVEVEASLAGVTVATSGREPLASESSAARVELGMRLSQQQLSRLPPAVLDDAPLGNDRCWHNGVALWSPEHPLLYDVAMRLFDAQSGVLLDEVRTQAGMRSIDWCRGDGLWRLNGRPYFQALCLDQGYWPDSLMTPPCPDSTRLDIELAKRMGFNGCRKHQKVVDPLFSYWSDRLGYLVWAEAANAYRFSPEYVDRFSQEWTEAVRLAMNHPSVVTWTPVNESWGYPSLKDSAEQQSHMRALYHLTKTLDPTRSVNDNCGWEHVCTDLTTFHDYSDGPELEKTCASLHLILGAKAGRGMFVGGAEHRPGAPVMCTEFGGVNIASASVDGEARDWGYTTASDGEDLLARFERLVKAVTNGGPLLTDIEQEANGLYSFDRREKLDARRVKAVIDEAVQAFYARVGSP